MRRVAAFSLIELLVVIGIIAILAAIIFPVYARAKDSAFRSDDMAAMNTLRSALQLYHADQGGYPPALLGYVTLYTSGPNAGNIIPADKLNSYLYPRRVKALSTFQPAYNRNGPLMTTTAVYPNKDPRPLGDAPVMDLNGDGVIDAADDILAARQAYGPGNGFVCPDGGVVGTNCPDGAEARFYMLSGFDVSEVRTPFGDRFELRYTLFWTGYGLASGNASDDPRQLGYRYPPDDTVITWNSDYRNLGADLLPKGGNRDIVLLVGGSARPFSSRDVYNRSWRVVSNPERGGPRKPMRTGGRNAMRPRGTSGSSLIEILVVIVVFLVGVLALVQIFPPGLSALRTTSASLLATSLAESEVERIAGSSGQMPDYIGTVSFRMTPGGLEAVLDASVATRDLMPPKDPDPAPGRLNQAGQIVLESGTLGDWQLVGASNRINRVIGESHKVPAPRIVGTQFGCLVNLNFGPIYYYLQPTGVGAGFLQVYGNEMARRHGDRRSSSPIPASFGVPREWEFYFVDRDLTGPPGPAQPFPGQDQIWVGPSNAKELRVAMTFAYASPGGTQQFEMVLGVQLNPLAPPKYAAIVDRYWVISLPELVGQPDIHMRTLYNPANVLGVYRDSVRVQRLYQEIPITVAFNPLNPFQYKAINGNFGTILVNPVAFDCEVRTAGG
ncbi:MAG: type II secretion system protein, partial [Armatimonadetes bacterium]|nr:type II secretion system protein [Armatimonadota bacterium]